MDEMYKTLARWDLRVRIFLLSWLGIAIIGACVFAGIGGLHSAFWYSLEGFDMATWSGRIRVLALLLWAAGALLWCHLCFKGEAVQ